MRINVCARVPVFVRLCACVYLCAYSYACVRAHYHQQRKMISARRGLQICVELSVHENLVL